MRESEAAGATALAWLGGRLATGLIEITSDLAALDRGGWWAVALPFDGPAVCARFAHVRTAAVPLAPEWEGPSRDDWRSSMSAVAYQASVEATRRAIGLGQVYQANICRILRADVASTPPPGDGREPGPAALTLLSQILRHNPAPHAGMLHLPRGVLAGWKDSLTIVSASPETFLRRRGDLVESSPIKGTARPRPAGSQAMGTVFGEKDRAENVMIVDLVRNDLGRVAVTGSVEVAELLTVVEHPGLVHLESTVRARLRPAVRWPELLAATFPPGSVTGAPKVAALRLIRELEPTTRGYYCGAFGWVDADAGTADLAVAIRTFILDDRHIRFGTGAGITWPSDPGAEWEETELKSHRLIRLASDPGRTIGWTGPVAAAR